MFEFGEIKNGTESISENSEFTKIKPEVGMTFDKACDYLKEKFSKIQDGELSLGNKDALDTGQKEIIKKDTAWSDRIIDSIKNMDQYEVLKNGNLEEAKNNGREVLIKGDIDLDYTDKDGISNRDRMERGLAPIDVKTEKPIELHHLGQKADSPLVELNVEEHRTGDYKDGQKNQSLWHDSKVDTDVHGEGNDWDQERKSYWKERVKMN